MHSLLQNIQPDRKGGQHGGNPGPVRSLGGKQCGMSFNCFTARSRPYVLMLVPSESYEQAARLMIESRIELDFFGTVVLPENKPLIPDLDFTVIREPKTRCLVHFRASKK